MLLEFALCMINLRLVINSVVSRPYFYVQVLYVTIMIVIGVKIVHK